MLIETALYLRPGGGEGQGAGGGGVFPYIGHIGMCRPHLVGFLNCFDLKRVYTWPILVWNCMGRRL